MSHTDGTYRTRSKKNRSSGDRVISFWMYVPVVVSLIVGLTLSIAAYAAVWQDVSTEMENNFIQTSSERISMIRTGMVTNLQFLDYIKAFYNGSELITKDEFKLFVDFGMANLQSFQTVGWAPEVMASEREQFESETGEIYYVPEPNQRSAVPERLEYFPIKYIEPFSEGSSRYLGFDLSARSVATQRLLTHARDNDLTVATNWVRLPLVTAELYGVTFYQPIYNVPGDQLTTVEQRRANFLGYVFGIFRIKDIIDSSLPDLDRQVMDTTPTIDITVSNYSQYLGTEITYDYISGEFSPKVVPSELTQEEAIVEMLEQSSNPPGVHTIVDFPVYESYLEFSGRRWHVIFEAGEEYIQENRTWHAGGVLLLGLLVTVLVTAYCISNIGYAARTERLVKQRTVELERANEELESGIFERKRAKDAVVRLNRDLEEKNRELESMIYATSHDFRSPLLNIKGFSLELKDACESLLSELRSEGKTESLTPKLSELLEKGIPEAVQFIQASVNKMDKLLGGILRLSRLGKATLTIEPLGMNRMLSQITKSMEYQIKETEVTLEVGNLPKCLGDENQINQVFSNLLDNALKYIEPTRESLIHISGVLDANERAVYCVKDNGVGIKSEQQDSIFDMFHRLEPDKLIGEGLGLTIARRIIARHNGRIWVESHYGEGSEFWVMLPGIEMDGPPPESSDSETGAVPDDAGEPN
ncbi:MAG: hypothetical protein GY869_24585 [Planctomycetes bacterium]|nr:hypothetical protein [Planctomycetota bacterium]